MKNSLNYEKHGIRFEEAEEVFFDNNRRGQKIEREGLAEERYFVIGKTNEGVLMTIIYTFRGNKIRIISARHPKTKEVRLYKSV